MTLISIWTLKGISIFFSSCFLIRHVYRHPSRKKEPRKQKTTGKNRKENYFFFFFFFAECKRYSKITSITFISVHPWVTSIWTGSGHVITLYTTPTGTASLTIQAVCVNITPCNISCVRYKWSTKTPTKYETIVSII